MPMSQIASSGCILELEIAPNAQQAFEYNANNTVGFSLQDCFLFATEYDVDSSISNSIVEHVASGEPLPFHLTTVHATRYFLSQNNFSIAFQRASTSF